MKLRISEIILAGAVLFFLFTSANASYINPSDGFSNITTYDGYSSSSGWYGTQENNEVEPGAATGQGWDLEGFYLNEENNTLALVGGFDFVDGGEDLGYSWVQSGDIFLETGDENDFYDYVLDMDFEDLTYTVYDLTGGGSSTAKTHGGPAGPTQGLPWSYTGGGTVVAGYQNLSFGYVSGLTDAQMGGDLGSGPHNAAFVDLSFLAPNTDFSSFFTMTCGNDVLTGAGSTSGGAVPEPATILLLGFGLAALGARTRKRNPKVQKDVEKAESQTY